MRYRSLILVLLLALLLPFLPHPSAAQASKPPQTYIRFAQFAAHAEAVDFYVDGVLSRTTNLPFTRVGEWTVIAPGKHSFMVVPAGGAPGTAILHMDNVYLDPETWHTIAVVNSGMDFKSAVIDENFREMQSVVSRVTFFNGMDDGTMINFDRSGGTFVSEIAPVDTPGYRSSFQSGMDARLYDYFSVVDTHNHARVLARIDRKQMIEGSVYLFAMVGGPQPRLIIIETPRYEYRLVSGLMEQPGKLRQALETDSTLQPFLQAMDQAGLSDILDSDKAYTILAPIDFAMDPVLKRLGQNPVALAYFLQGLIVEGDLKSNDLYLAGRVTTLNGTRLKVVMHSIPNNNEYGYMTIDGREVMEMNVPAVNGTIFVLGQEMPGVTVWTPDTAVHHLEVIAHGDEPVGGTVSSQSLP